MTLRLEHVYMYTMRVCFVRISKVEATEKGSKDLKK